MTSCPSETRMSLRILRDMAESSTTNTFAIRNLQQRLCHLLQRYDLVREIGLDDRSWHTVYNASLFCFSENRSSSRLDLGRTGFSVIPHSGHDNPQHFVSERFRSRSEENIYGWAVQQIQRTSVQVNSDRILIPVQSEMTSRLGNVETAWLQFIVFVRVYDLQLCQFPQTFRVHFRISGRHVQDDHDRDREIRRQ